MNANDVTVMSESNKDMMSGEEGATYVFALIDLLSSFISSTDLSLSLSDVPFNTYSAV